MSGRDMLGYVDLSRTAVERSPGLIGLIRDWTGLPKLDPLTTEQWFWEAHGIVGGYKDARQVWIPTHAKGSQTYLWSPPPVLADVALEEALKAKEKRHDSTHIFIIPEFFDPQWTRLLFKICDVIFRIPVGNSHWPSAMHESLCVGISLPYLPFRPWSIKGTPLVVGVERKLRRMWSTGEGDGCHCVRKFLRTAKGLASMSESMASRVLSLSGRGNLQGRRD